VLFITGCDFFHRLLSRICGQLRCGGGVHLCGWRNGINDIYCFAYFSPGDNHGRTQHQETEQESHTRIESRKRQNQAHRCPRCGAGKVRGACQSAQGGQNRQAEPVKPKTPRVKAAKPVEAKPASVTTAEQKSKRVKKEKVVRDSFTMPKSDYEKLAALKQKCLDSGVAVKKSELLRAGLLLLEGVPIARLLDAISAVETVKTGRPAKSSQEDAAQ
jgi:hypothetical protein